MRHVAVFLSALLLAAHFLRAGDLPLVLLALLVPALLWVRRPWAPRVVQAALGLGALEWVRTLWAALAQRQAAGEPWLRMALILGGVALFTALSALAARGAGRGDELGAAAGAGQ